MTDHTPNLSPDELVAQGITAYEAGDATTARRLLTQAVKQDASSVQAWWYLSKVQTEDEKRLQCLRRVVKLDPSHSEAAAALDRLTQKLEAEMSREEYVLRDQAKQAVPTAAGNAGGFSVPLPPGIEGAPLRLSLNDTVAFVKDKTAESLAVVQKSNTAIDQSRASWWQIVFMAFLVGLVTGIIQVIGTAIISFRLLTVFSPILVPLYTILFALVGVGAACFMSHWYITKVRGGQATLLHHSYPLTVIWAAASIVNLVPILLAAFTNGSVISVYQWLALGLFSNIGGLSLVFSLVSLGLALGAAFLMVKQLSKLYTGISTTQLWVTALIYLLIVGTVF